MADPTHVVLVRFRSRLPFDEVMKIAEERAPEFRALEGLRQKYYLQEPVTGEIGGLYLWESAEALADFSQSELRASIAESYQAEGEPRVGVYHVVKTLREG